MGTNRELTAYEQGVLDRRMNAKQQRMQGGSLSDYVLRAQIDWLGGEAPPSNGSLTVYRAVKDGDIHPGDYVTNSQDYALQHLSNNMQGQGCIIDVQATLGEIFPADGPREFWYLPMSLDDERQPNRDRSRPRG